MSDHNIVKFQRKRRRRQAKRRRFPYAATVVIVAFLGVAGIAFGKANVNAPDLACYQPDIVDGDTFRCDGQRVRLVGIDAPEMPGHCRPGRRCVDGDPHAAKDYLSSITRTRVECASEGTDKYGRTLGRCKADEVDLSCAMLEAGHAERRYGVITCW